MYKYGAKSAEQEAHRKAWYKAWNPGYRDKHRLRIRETARKAAVKRREKALKLYGGKCSCCGEKTYEFLTFDHKKGGGRRHRKGDPRNTLGDGLVRWLLRLKRKSKEFDVLCMNCNHAKGHYGVCPHKRLRNASSES